MDRGGTTLGFRGWFVVALVGMSIFAAVTLTWVRAEGTTPDIADAGDVLVGVAGREVTLELADVDSGIRSVVIVLRHANGEEVLVDKTYPGGWLRGATSTHPKHLTVSIVPAELGLKSGSAILFVSVVDWSWRGNAAELAMPIEIDTSTPRIRVSTGLTYIRRGGAGSVQYTVDEATAIDGVWVGREGEEGAVFYRGYPAGGHSADASLPASGGEHIALYAVADDAPADPHITVFAEDAAGNAASATWPVVVKDRKQNKGIVTLPQSFLDRVVVSLAREEKIPTDDLAAAFHRINTEVRARNEATVREQLRDSAQQPLFRGAFEQLRNSKVTSKFAEQRTYFVGPKRVSEATHYGYDLASTAAAPITASNAGRVMYAGELGIYGQCVLIDHGLGLATLYGHLSRIDTAVGESVEKGDVLGRSGATGLAGGDHLHFAMLVGDTYVDPVEWWDPKWVETHVAEVALR